MYIFRRFPIIDAFFFFKDNIPNSLNNAIE